jgi:hypothetical protein
MSDNSEDFEISVTSRGGHGRSAIWHWSVQLKGTAKPLKSGAESGSYDKAVLAANKAIAAMNLRAEK